MSESVQFWLDNKMSAGIKVAEIGSQQLVIYRDKYYVIENGAARMKGSKPLHFSKTSMPLIWKKALRGDVPPVTPEPLPGDEIMPITSTTKKKRMKPDQLIPHTDPEQPSETSTTVPQPAINEVKKRMEKTAGNNLQKAAAIKPAVQSSVIAGCPYCNQKQDLPLEKGRNGKPFFVTCTKCKADFAVRYVPVTVYQAQVAGFR